MPSAPWVVETRKKYKKWKNFETFKFLQERSQKHCLSMFCLIISTEKISAQCTLETQKSFTEMEKNSNFQNCPKTFPRLSKHILMWFFRSFLASAPWRVEKSKNFKEMQNLPKIQDTQTRFQKYPNKFWTCFEVFLEKKVPSAPWRVETWKNLRKIEKLFSQYDQNLSQKCSNTFSTCFDVVFLVKKKWPFHPGGSKLGKIRKKNRQFRPTGWKFFHFLNFSEFWPPKVPWAKFSAQKNYLEACWKHENMFEHFWERICAFRKNENFSSFLKFFQVSTLQCALKKKTSKKILQNKFGHSWNRFSGFWNFEIFSIFVDFF